MRKLVDCFLYNNEIELLNIRLQLLDDVVDQFVIVWASETFTGRKKEQSFPWKSAHVAAIKHKIDLIEIAKLPGRSAWDKEAYSRNSLARGLRDLASDDLVVVSDVDEIPRPDVLRELRQSYSSGIRVLAQDYFNFKFNFQLVNGTQATWAGPIVCDFGSFSTPQALRDMRWALLLDPAAAIHDAGWHFSFLTHSASVEEKLASFSHQERDIQRRNGDVNRLIDSRQGFHDHIEPGSVWAVVNLADLRCDSLADLIRRYPNLMHHGVPDSPAIIQTRVKLSVSRMKAFERAKVLRWCSLGEIRRELMRRVRARVG